ncbi:hypothetical protein Ahy_B06g084564 [Arachis hypogaea]|uniref:Uncharacterized protein n=1 Tax=Arachis hypogaea TaxID=3818 RepID=A0A444YS90_ARAHY|nr:hypothetical protein Ahy_B06g084564 [Arachis hypogaea]
MVVLKMFLNPTSQQTISPWHLPPILEVSNPRRFHWPYQILKWLRDAIRKFQDENRKTCGGCMFVLLVLYFQRLKHGPLRACQVPEPWIVEWTTNELDKKADHLNTNAIGGSRFFSSLCCPMLNTQGCIVNNAKKEIKKKKKQSSSKAINEKERCKKPLKDPDQSPSTQGKTTSQPSYKEANKVIYFLYDRSVARSRSEENSSARTLTSRHLLGARQNLIIGISKRRRCAWLITISCVIIMNPGLVRGENCLSAEADLEATPKKQLQEKLSRKQGCTVGSPELSDDEDNVPLARRIRLFEQQRPPHDVKQAEPAFKSKNKGPQEENTDHKDASPHTPPAAHVQLSDYDFDRLQPFPIHSIHPSLRNIKLGETKEKQIRTWIVNSSLNSDQDLASYEGRDYMVLQRKDFWTLKPPVDPTPELQGPKVLNDYGLCFAPLFNIIEYLLKFRTLNNRDVEFTANECDMKLAKTTCYD